MATTAQQTEDALIAEWIEPHPTKGGRDEYRLNKERAISVWAIIGYLEATQGDRDRVARTYLIPREAVDAAIAYYERNREVIDNRLDANEP